MVKPKGVHDIAHEVLAEVPAGAIVRWTIAIDYVSNEGWHTSYVKGPTLYGVLTDLARQVHNDQVTEVLDERGY